MSDITSRPYRPAMACERCCFGQGLHSAFCGREFVSWVDDPERYGSTLAFGPDQYNPTGPWLTWDDSHPLYRRYMDALKATLEDKARWLCGDWANVKETE